MDTSDVINNTEEEVTENTTPPIDNRISPSPGLFFPTKEILPSKFYYKMHSKNLTIVLLHLYFNLQRKHLNAILIIDLKVDVRFI